MGSRVEMIGRIIETPECVAEGAEFLAAAEPRFAAALRVTGPLPLRRRSEGFEQLLGAIVSQQVSVAAADSIWNRIRMAGLDDPRMIGKADDPELRAVGLSRQKIRYARALASAGIDYNELRELPDEDVISILTAVHGIGRWTAEIYLMFSLGRADAFAAGDLALREAARTLFETDDRPNDRQLRAMAEAWTPWRAVAARLLWAYYRVVKEREGVR